MTVTVYAASSSHIAPVYFRAAKELGQLLAQNHINCINGGGNEGLMAEVIDAMLENGGKITGIIPQFMIDKGWCHPALNELIVTPDMHTRKQMMIDRSDACIALPGGIGTLEELLEMITWKQLRLHSKPIIILNINHFYDDLLRMLKKTEQEKFLFSESALWSVAETPHKALNML
jgi:uncharacterized protein (TIGR00730 family)